MGNPGSPCVSQPPTQSSAPASPNSHRLAITPAGPASSLVDCIQPLLPPLPNTSLSMPQSKLPSSHSTYSEQRLRRPERAGKHPAIPTAYPARLTLLHPQRPWHSYSLASRALAPPRPLLTRPDHPVKSHSWHPTHLLPTHSPLTCYIMNLFSISLLQRTAKESDLGLLCHWYITNPGTEPAP